MWRVQRPAASSGCAGGRARVSTMWRKHKSSRPSFLQLAQLAPAVEIVDVAFGTVTLYTSAHRAKWEVDALTSVMILVVQTPLQREPRPLCTPSQGATKRHHKKQGRHLAVL